MGSINMRRLNMNHGILAAAVLATSLAFADDVKVEDKPLAIGALSEFGFVDKGLFRTAEGSSISSMEWVDHFGAFVTKQAIVNERLFLSAGLGGVFQFRKPETKGAGFAAHQRKAFFIGPTQSEAVYHLGDVDNPWLKLGAGQFFYKYNPEAANLGEMLFRSGPYPTIVTTGGYVVVNSAAANVQGFKANYQAGPFKADMLLTTETNMPPFYDWSLGLVASYSLGEGLLDVGAGVNFKRLIPVRPSRTKRKIKDNAYFKDATGKYFVGNVDFYGNSAEFNLNQAKKAYALGNNALGDHYASQSSRDSAAAEYVSLVNNLPDGDPAKPAMNYYTSQGILLMVRATFDMKKLFTDFDSGPDDLKMFFEANVLGVKNYPVYYNKVTERIPIMAGFNLPTFRMLDLLSIQMEYFNSPWYNNTNYVGQKLSNIPLVPLGTDAILSRAEYNDQTKKDNWKWSVLAKKTIQGRLTLSAQVASDHLRLTSSEYYYGPQFDHNEVTAFTNHWYWMTQVSWGI